MNHPELAHGLELLPCAIRDGMLYIPHADGNWVSAAKLQPFSLKIIECWRAEQVEASRSRAASESGEVARLAGEANALARKYAYEQRTAANAHETLLSAMTLGQFEAAIDRLASMATSPASEAQAGWRQVLKRAKDGLGAGGRNHCDQEFIDYGAALIDHIKEGIEALAASPQAQVAAEGQKAPQEGAA